MWWKKMSNVLMACTLLLLIASCETHYPPKPKAYPRIELPAKEYKLFEGDCSFTFEYPTYAGVEQKDAFFNELPTDPCWMDIVFPAFAGTIHISYKAVNDENTLEQLLEHAHKLTWNHTKRAEYIDESVIENQYGVKGLYAEVGGDAASNAQFYVTDNKNHYLRGSLYFRTIPNEDSLAPVIDFVKADMLHFLETFRWVD